MSIPTFSADTSLYISNQTYSSALNSSQEGNSVIAQGWFDWVPGLGTVLPGGCTNRCWSKKGFGACVARCQIDNKACDNGSDNCS